MNKKKLKVQFEAEKLVISQFMETDKYHILYKVNDGDTINIKSFKWEE